MSNTKLLSTRNMVVIAILGAIAGLLMLVEIPLTFVAPNFYKLDISEVPVMIGTFALGPVAGILTELIKLLVKFVIKGSSTGGVGELANFLIGCAMVIPAGIVYQIRKTKKRAMLGMGLGIATMALAGLVMNALVLLPFYAKFMPLEQIIAAGARIFPQIDSVWSFALWCVMPFNLIKGVVIFVLTMLLYKRVSRLIKEFGRKA
ncbi:MAG: ECF transporter S component [Lachnospiraceae bacterium]|nr:ECF transporter S component [Lachnospiraceae bacterium]